MSSTENQRVRITKRLLQENLIEILKTKSIQQVSVTELCRAAGVNRSTFYAHYSIPLDVLSDVKEEFANRLAASLDQIRAENSPRHFLTVICAYLYEHRELERIILANSNDDEVLEAALASSFQVWGTASPFLQVQNMDEEAQRLAVVFYYHGIFRVIREWIRRDIQKTPGEVADILYAILFGE